MPFVVRFDHDHEVVLRHSILRHSNFAPYKFAPKTILHHTILRHTNKYKKYALQGLCFDCLLSKNLNFKNVSEISFCQIFKNCIFICCKFDYFNWKILSTTQKRKSLRNWHFLQCLVWPNKIRPGQNIDKSKIFDVLVFYQE